jgi:hypothetical protein
MAFALGFSLRIFPLRVLGVREVSAVKVRAKEGGIRSGE